MNKKKFIYTAKNIINLEIDALKKLKKNINNSFSDAVIKISKCQSKVILCGVGKSGIIASKIAATLASVGTPSFNLSASEASHGDLGMISKKDILVLISNSGETNELKNIIQFANRNKILLIGIVSKKNSTLYRGSDIKILLPQVNEAEGIIPTSSTTAQLALGDAIAITTMKYKKFGKLDFKKLGVVITKNNKNLTTGIVTDGDIKRLIQKHSNFKEIKLKKIARKKPISVEKNLLAAKALKIMNEKKITSLCVHDETNKNKTIGLLHIHNILEANID